ncbi:MAG TPA: site-specific integrase, partial [Dissulfuribacter thermophilus]|nr:site-specific integrase [Dissulfuribacter thermophilus]
MAKKRFHKVKRFVGVYYEESKLRPRVNGQPDKHFLYTLKRNGKMVRRYTGWLSEGMTAELTSHLRGEELRKIRLGDEVKTTREIRAEKRKTNRTLEEIKEAYFLSNKGQSIKGRKTDLNRWDKHLKPLVGTKRVSELSPFDIERIKKAMADKKPATIANALELLRRIINFGIKHGLCPSLKFTIELPKKDNEVTEYLTEDEARRLVEVLDSWPSQDVARMVKLAMLTGMRRGEIFKLKIEDVDFTQGLITLVDPKGGKTEHLPMSEPVRELLRDQIAWAKERYPETQFVFPGRGGGQRVDCSAVERIKEVAGLPKSFRPFHGLRHHFAVTLASSGNFTLDMIGELLTHKDTKVTRRYAKFLPEAKKKAAEEAARLISENVDSSSTGKVVTFKLR